MTHSISCYHCSLPIEGEPGYFAEIEEEQRPMCCPGCKAVAETISDSGMGNYYRYRTTPALRVNELDEKLKAEYLLYDQDKLQQDFVSTSGEGEREAQLLIEGVNCAACVWLIENHLKQYSGVVNVSVNLTELTLRIRWQPDKIKLSALLLQLHDIGYRPHPWHIDKRDSLMKKESRSFLLKLAVAGIGTMQVMMYAIALYAGGLQDMELQYRDLIRWVSAIVATPVVFYAASPFFAAAWRGIKLKTLSMDVPVSLAIGGAYVASLVAVWQGGGEVYFDSVCMFTFFLLIGRYLELRARHQTTRRARELNHLLPASCLKIVENIAERVSVKDIKVQDCLRILPGETVPADGVVTAGMSSVNEAAVSGEYIPVKKSVGATVIAGSSNAGDAFDMQVTAAGGQTRLSGIMRLLSQAGNEKPKMTMLANRIASWFVGAVIIISFVVYLSWFLLGSSHAFWIMLSVLVITCPCALSLATPVALTAATNVLQKLGFLVTRAHLLETLPEVTHVIFDKTGTLTYGKLIIKQVIPVDGHNHTVEQLLAMAAALESHSSHPIASAFSDYLSRATCVSRVASVTGSGMSGYVNGVKLCIGKPNFCLPGQMLFPPGGDGQWILLSDSKQPLAWFELCDEIREEAYTLIQALKQRNIQVELLSGDRQPVVAAMADTLGIERWQAENLPEDKLERVRHLQATGAKVLMVGDGINDVPVLAGADVSLAMNNATDLTKTHADSVLLSSNVMKIINAIDISKKTKAIVQQNIAWSLTYNIAALPLAAVGLIPPWAAAIGMSASSLIVVGNALRLSAQSADNKDIVRANRFFQSLLCLKRRGYNE